MAEYHQYFGGSPTVEHVRFKLAKLTGEPPKADVTTALSTRDATPLRVGKSAYTITQVAGKYLLYYAMRLFFENDLRFLRQFN